jgi:hypothetical protein
MWGMGSIAGRQCIGWTLPASIDSFSRRIHRAPLSAVADEGVPFIEIARVVGRRLNVPVMSKSPEEAAGHFDWFAQFAGLDCPSSSALTQQRLEWRPTHSSLIPDIDRPIYFETTEEIAK